MPRELELSGEHIEGFFYVALVIARRHGDLGLRGLLHKSKIIPARTSLSRSRECTASVRGWSLCCCWFVHKCTRRSFTKPLCPGSHGFPCRGISRRPFSSLKHPGSKNPNSFLVLTVNIARDLPEIVDVQQQATFWKEGSMLGAKKVSDEH